MAVALVCFCFSDKITQIEDKKAFSNLVQAPYFLNQKITSLDASDDLNVITYKRLVHT